MYVLYAYHTAECCFMLFLFLSFLYFAINLRASDISRHCVCWKAMMKRQMREAATDQQEAARVACLAKRQEARERRAEERKVQQMKQREFQRELPA